MKRMQILRMIKGWSQKQLADYSGTTQAIISQMESGKMAGNLGIVHSVTNALGYKDGYDIMEEMDDEAVILSIDDYWKAVDAEVTAALSAYQQRIEEERKAYAMETQGKQRLDDSSSSRFNSNRYKRSNSSNGNRKTKKNYY